MIRDLTPADCEAHLSLPIIVGRKSIHGSIWSISHVPWTHQYEVGCNGRVMDSGKGLQQMLEIYNNARS